MTDKKERLQARTNERIATATGSVLDMLINHNPAEIITKTYFQKWKTDKPLNNWSFLNQMICLSDYLLYNPDIDPMDAIDKMDFRGFKQWNKVDRKVQKGSHAYCFILSPLVAKKEKKDGSEDTFIKGFKATPVFEYTQTEGEPLESVEKKDPRMEVIRKFEFMEVAKKLGLKVKAGVSGHGEYGYYQPSYKIIQVCTPEEMTFFHELAHAVDDHLLKQKTGEGLKGGQVVEQEIVAQFSSNVLAYLTGKQVERTTAYTRQYITGYLNGKDLSKAIMELMSRINNVIDYIVQNSETTELNCAKEGACV